MCGPSLRVKGMAAIRCAAVPDDLVLLADPVLIVQVWAAGLALVAGYVSLQRIVGPGFVWLTAGTSFAIGLAGAFAEGAWLVRLGLVLVVVGLIWARNQLAAGILLSLGGAALTIGTVPEIGWLAALSGTVALGGVTGEMMLGHWYLVDPRLPRSALRLLAVAGIAGLVADSLVLIGIGLPDSGATIAYWVLLATSVVLMVAVIAALRYPAYSGVMAATGLSYLAVLTTLGAIFLGRALAAGLGPFTT